MGCGASTEAAPPQKNNANNISSNVKSPYTSNSGSVKKDDPQELVKSAGIDRDLDRARQQEELKVKLLLLGAGESGKSTIFKQMRILHGAPRSEDDLRMYGVVVRSNVVTAMRKLCTLLRNLGLEDQLAKEPKAEDDNGTGMTPKQAYDLVVAHLVDGTAQPEDLAMPPTSSKDWVGSSPRAGLGANNDAQQFLQLWRYIKTLWEVRTVRECFWLNYLLAHGVFSNTIAWSILYRSRKQ
jgi:G-protein alpha subunit